MKSLPAQTHNLYRWLMLYGDAIETVIILDYDGDGVTRGVAMSLADAKPFIDYEFTDPDSAMQIMAYSADWVYFTVVDYAVSLNRVPRNPEKVSAQ